MSQSALFIRTILILKALLHNELLKFIMKNLPYNFQFGDFYNNLFVASIFNLNKYVCSEFRFSN